jgi:hypothetical protein
MLLMRKRYRETVGGGERAYSKRKQKKRYVFNEKEIQRNRERKRKQSVHWAVSLYLAG